MTDFLDADFNRSYFPNATPLPLPVYLPMFGPLTPTPGLSLADVVLTKAFSSLACGDAAEVTSLTSAAESTESVAA